MRIEREKASLTVDGINVQSRKVSFSGERNALSGPVYIGGLPSDHKAAEVITNINQLSSPEDTSANSSTRLYLFPSFLSFSVSLDGLCRLYQRSEGERGVVKPHPQCGGGAMLPGAPPTRCLLLQPGRTHHYR